MKRIAIMGVGSLGTILGAYISKSGRQIDLIDVNKEHVDALNKNGAKVIGKVNMTVSVKALTPDEMEGIYDLVLYMTKQTYNETALRQLLPHINENSIVCTLQNGLPEPAVCEVVGNERVMGAPVEWGATFRGPGVSELTSDANHLSFTLGTIDGKVTDKLMEVKQILESMCPVRVSNNLMGLRWTKLLMNATFSGLSTVLGGTFGDVLDSDEAMNYIAEIGKECVQVAYASGVKLEPYLHYDFREIFKFKNDEEKNFTIEKVREIWGPHRALMASMLQDLKKGRKCEIDAINGIVSVFGKEKGVATPINDIVVEIIKGIESGKYTYEAKNIELLRK